MIDPSQVVRYLIVGGLVTLADIVVYNFLTGTRHRMPRIPANIFSTTCGMVLGFALHFALVFHPHEAQVPARLIKYVVTVGCSVYGVQNLVIYGLGEYWRGPARLAQGMARHFEITSDYSDDFIDRMTGKVTAVLAGIVWNFFFFKYFVYA